MSREKLLLTFCFLSFKLFTISNCRAPCVPSSCGNLHNITPPFRLTSDPPGCGYQYLELSCEDNSAVLNLREGRFIVKAVNYNNYTIRVINSDFDKGNCSSIPRFPLSPYYISEPYTLEKGVGSVQVIKCLKPVNSTAYLDVNSCITQVKDGFYRYAFVGTMDGNDLRDGCNIEAITLVQLQNNSVLSFTEIQRQMALGFELSWESFYRYGELCLVGRTGNITCYARAQSFQEFLIDWLEYTTHFFGRHYSGKKILSKIAADIRGYGARDWLIFYAPALILLYVAGRSLCGAPIVMAFIVYKWRKRHLSGYYTIEEFLKGENNPIMPIRYAYSDIKKMTGGFKEMLGKGGFGSVYKGKLRSGQYAAVKMLETSKAKGQDFINEVATLGRIHHANIVRLIGFCSQGSKNALVFEFMANGSLDTHIFNQERSITLGWEKLFEISLGVARGIEYLHRGCEVQILHFDIKPHNILLDENFAPKISDFGLAKFYQKMDSIASLTAARGTIGYMAPELFYKNIGRISYKADVYSFGMLLLEMAGKRKKIKVPTEDASNDNLSQIYYPFWVYDKLVDGSLVIEDTTDEEKKIVRKMIITGLWCIQMQPSSRPSMNKVVEMLEGNLEDLQFPPKPILFPIKSMKKDEEDSASLSTSVE